MGSPLLRRTLAAATLALSLALPWDALGLAMPSAASAAFISVAWLESETGGGGDGAREGGRKR